MESQNTKRQQKVEKAPPKVIGSRRSLQVKATMLISLEKTTDLYHCVARVN